MRPRLEDVSGRDVSRETLAKIDRFRSLLIDENERQNLISKTTIPDFDERHVIDAAQLLGHAGNENAHWLDVGSGAGLPGIVLAILHRGPVTLVEPRRLRADFLQRVVDDLALDHVDVLACRIEAVDARPSVITGRAVANIAKFFAMTAHLADFSTQYVLPKGRKAREELAQAKKLWQGRFEFVPSVTDPEASILLASDVRRRGER